MSLARVYTTKGPVPQGRRVRQVWRADQEGRRPSSHLRRGLPRIRAHPLNEAGGTGGTKMRFDKAHVGDTVRYCERTHGLRPAEEWGDPVKVTAVESTYAEYNFALRAALEGSGT